MDKVDELQQLENAHAATSEHVLNLRAKLDMVVPKLANLDEAAHLIDSWNTITNIISSFQAQVRARIEALKKEAQNG